MDEQIEVDRELVTKTRLLLKPDFFQADYFEWYILDDCLQYFVTSIGQKALRKQKIRFAPEWNRLKNIKVNQKNYLINCGEVIS